MATLDDAKLRPVCILCYSRGIKTPQRRHVHNSWTRAEQEKRDASYEYYPTDRNYCGSYSHSGGQRSPKVTRRIIWPTI